MDSLDFGMSPVDIPGADGPKPLGWTSQIIATSAALLVLLNPAALRDWAHDLPAGPASQPVMAAADAWCAALDEAGITIRQTMHGLWHDATAPDTGKPPASRQS